MSCKPIDAWVQAMDGAMSLEDALRKRLSIIDCRPHDIAQFIKAHPPASRLTEVCILPDSVLVKISVMLQRSMLPPLRQGIAELVTALLSRGVAVYLISGGFR